MPTRASKSRRIAATLCLATALTGCVPGLPPLKLSTKPSEELRAMQKRTIVGFTSGQVLEGTVSALMDLGYMIDKADATTGSISASRAGAVRLTATAQQTGTSTVLRCDAALIANGANSQIDLPDFYQQDFFGPVEQSLILSRKQPQG